jgi:hypothetical protein
LKLIRIRQSFRHEYVGALTFMTRGIGVMVVATSATQLMIPQTSVTIPSSMQLPSEVPSVQYLWTGTHRKTARNVNEMKIPMV